MKPQIVILSHRDDEHALAVLSALSASVTPFLLDIGRTGSDFVVTRTTDSVLKLLTRSGDYIYFDETGFWWNRRPRIASFDNTEKRFAQAQEIEIEEFWIGVLGRGLAGTWCNPFDAQRRAQHKIRQIHVAQRVGLRTPDTLWTNNPRDLEAFIDKHSGGVVFKMFAGSEAVWQPCRKFDHSFIDHIDHTRFMPAIYQEYLTGAAEYRVTIFGEHCFAARADMSTSRYPTDVRIDLTLTRTPETLDVELELLLRTFMRESNLLYATFDVREDSNGDPVFLECNPMGQFLYLDGIYNGAMLRTFCKFIESHVQTLAAHAEPTNTIEASVDFSREVCVPIYQAAESWSKHMPAEEN